MLAPTIKVCVDVSLAMFLKLASLCLKSNCILVAWAETLCHTSDRCAFSLNSIISVLSSMASCELKIKVISFKKYLTEFKTQIFETGLNATGCKPYPNKLRKVEVIRRSGKGLIARGALHLYFSMTKICISPW